MRKKLLYILGGVIILSLLGVGIAYAFSVGSVDGVWGYVDGVENTSNYYPVDGLGYAREGVRAPLRENQGYRLSDTICAPMQNITPPWPNLSRWTDIGVDWTGFGTHSSSCTGAPGLMFSEFVYEEASDDGSCGSTSTSDDDCDLLAIEIVNRTGSSVNLADYDLLMFTGDRSYNTIALSGTLNNSGVYVIVNYRAQSSVTAYKNLTIANNNGYRPIVLVKNTGTDTEGARNDRWATGPGNLPTVYSDWNPNVQNLSTTDENQVRYGRDAFYTTYWRSYSAEITDFAQQSGFGFDGRNDPISPAALSPFFLGEFFHYNNQVYSVDDNNGNENAFGFVDLTVTVPVTCNDGSTPSPSSIVIVPRFILDETSNSAGTCVYGETGDVPCPDKVTVEMPAANPTFVCPDGTYTVNILGFTTKGLGTETCDVSYDANSVSAAFITQEDQNNQACLWARIEQPLADISAAKTCQQWNTTGRYYEITASNLGPGFARTVTLTDNLPSGVTIKPTLPNAPNGYTSQLITASGTISQGTCSIVGQVVNCSLGTPLLDYSTDPAAKWVVRIYVNLTGTTVLNTATVSSITTDPFPANNSSTASCVVTGVTLISFDAENKPEGVLLSWETASEVDNLGFNLYKSDGPEAEKVRINPVMIPSKVMGGTSGAFYEYLVENVEPGQAAFYWLEAVDFDLTTELYGPISVE